MWPSSRSESAANSTTRTLSSRIFFPLFYFNFCFSLFYLLSLTLSLMKRKPVACAIVSIGLDHCSILGNTHKEIAWQKAGIFKANSMAFTTEEVPSDALEVIKSRSVEKNVRIMLAECRRIESSFKF